MAQQLRSQVQGLADKANRDLAVVWRSVETPQQAAAALNDVLPALVQQYGAASATLAAIWYDDQRTRRGVRGRFEAITADLGSAGTDALAGYGAQAVAKHGGDAAAARVLVAGGLQRRIANYARQTVMTSAIADPSARGWQRVGSGDSCEFCSMLLGRGAVYSEDSASFEAHDHDECYAEPAW